MFTIIEDCSPYYVRFTHDKLDEVVRRGMESVKDVKFSRKFSHYKLDRDSVLSLKEVCPLFDSFDLNLLRVSMFVSQPGLYYRAHKDGLDHKFSLNYNVKILDQKCVTSWYSDEDLKDYPIDNLPTRNSRECMGFIKENHTPLKSMTASPNECVLFNTDLFHDWDNSNSENERMVLTLRLTSYQGLGTSFEDARKIILQLAGKDTE